jgi:hypothetical protein
MADPAVQEEEEETGEESLGTILAYSVGVPLSILFTTIALGYLMKDQPVFQNKQHPIYWIFWFVGFILLFTIASLVWGFIGVGWFLFETAILAIILQPVIVNLHKKMPQAIKRVKSVVLLLVNTFFLILSFYIFGKRKVITSSIDSDPIFIEIMIGAFFVLSTTVWLLYAYWDRFPSKYSVQLQEMLPLMFGMGMLIMYFETTKGLLKESQINWIEVTSVQMDFFTTVVLFFFAILDVTRDIVEHVDLDISLPKPKVGMLSRGGPYGLVLGIYVLYLSKYFYSDVLGISIPFLYAAIVFTFVSVLVLSYRIRKDLMKISPEY